MSPPARYAIFDPSGDHTGDDPSATRVPAPPAAASITKIPGLPPPLVTYAMCVPFGAHSIAFTDGSER